MSKTPHLQLHKIKGYLERFDRLGLVDRLPAELRERIDRAQTLREQAIAQSVSLGRNEGAIVGKLAIGTTTTAKAVKELMAARADSEVEEVTKRLLSSASDTAAHQASDILGQHAEALVTDVLAPFGVQQVDTLTKALQDIPPETTTADDAIRAGGNVATAWKVRVEAADAWRELVALLKQMRSDDLIEGRGPDAFLYLRHPERVGRGTLGDDLVAALRNNAEPRIVTEAQAQAEIVDAERQEAEQRQAEYNDLPPHKRRPYETGRRHTPAPTMEEIVEQVTR